jgi:hypothetical protein
VKEHCPVDYYLIINNDTIADKQLCGAFVDYLHRHPNKKTGMLCGKIYYHSKPDILWFAGGQYCPLMLKGQHRGEDEQDKGQFDQVTECTFATGCLWFIPVQAFHDVGYMDEGFFMYGEDLDYSLRMIKQGYSIKYLPQARIWHKIGKSQDSNLVAKYRMLNKSRIIIGKKHQKWPFLLVSLSLFFLTRLMRFAQLLLFRGKWLNTFAGSSSLFTKA